eukprot:5024253-Pyramimonas_sp.AAC.1
MLRALVPVAISGTGELTQRAGNSMGRCVQRRGMVNAMYEVSGDKDHQPASGSRIKPAQGIAPSRS